MTLGQRRILYTLFIMAFCAITPLVWLYASGYKIGDGLKVQKTGILILDTEPRGARIYLDGESQEYFFGRYLRSGTRYVTTPAKIKNLLPGEYEIRMEMDGYWAWQKKLAVLPGQSTFAEDVILFRNELPLLVAKDGFLDQSLSPDGAYSLAKTQIGAAFIDLKEQTALGLDRLASSTFGSAADVRWSSDRDRFAVGNDIYLSAKAGASDQGQRVARAGVVEWLDRDRLLFSDGDQLLSRDVRSGEEKLLFHGSQIQDIAVDGGQAYVLASQAGNNKLVRLEPGGGGVQNLLELPPSSYRFLESKNGLLLVLDRKFGIVYLLEPASPFRPIREIINNAGQAQLVAGGQLLYANEHEIWLMDLGNRQQTLLTRLSETINQAIWHPNKNYVLFATAGRIAAIELDKRERYNVTDLVKLEDIRDLALSPEGNSLYFLAKIGNQEGLYKLEIQ